MHLYSQFENAYLPDGVESSSTHRLATYVEKQVRFASCLIMACLVDNEKIATRLPKMTGLGGYLGFLRQAADELEHLNEHPDLAAVALTICDSLNQQAVLEESGLSVKQFRDYVAHAGLVPNDGRFDSALRKTIGVIVEAISSLVRHRGGTRLASDGRYFLNSTPLWPLFLQSDGYASLYQSVAGKEVTYYSLNRQALVRVERITPTSQYRDILRFVSQSPDKDPSCIRTFKDALVVDLRGFATLGEMKIDGLFSPFSLTWERATSGGSEPRTDEFRIGIRNDWQWRRGRSWVGYDAFIRDVANWEIVADRLANKLKSFADNWGKAERRILQGSESMAVPDSVQATLMPREFARRPSKMTTTTVGQLVDLADGSATEVTGRPVVYFITGEAGIGKTFNLLNLALKRAQALAQHPSADLPLYLYISCSGTGLKSLRDLINAAVADTRNLIYESVVSMCRNGQLVLVIDGFDELIGGAGYRDAFDQLRPLFEDLGDRGTLLLSARSAYLANQYRSSIELQSQAAGLQVDHHVLELQRWTPRHVDALFSANPAWQPLREKLTSSDIQLLGVPFFAQAFNAFARLNPDPEAFTSLRQVLVDAYLEREASKIGSPGAERTVSHEQLSAILEELAGELYHSREVSLGLDEFRLACAAGLEVSDTDPRNRAILDRLTVLCGMSSEVDEEGSQQFEFEHELLYEVFLARYAIKRFNHGSSSESQLINWLMRGVLGQACIEPMFLSAHSVILRVLPVAATRVTSDSGALAANLAALINEFARLREAIPALTLKNAAIAELDLAGARSFHVAIANSTIRLLRISGRVPQSLELTGVTIDQLEISGECTDLSWINIEGSVIENLFMPSWPSASKRYTSEEREIWCRLQELKVSCAGTFSTAPLGDSPAKAFARATLAHAARRGDWRYVVGSKSLLPAANAGRQGRSPDGPNWAHLIKTLVSHGLADLKPMNTSGSPKSALTFEVLPGDVLDAQSEDPRVKEFWAAI